MPIPTVHVTDTVGNSGTTGAVTYPWPVGYTPTADDVAVLCCEFQQTTPPGAPTNWTELPNSPRAQGANVVAVSVYYKRLVGGESAPQVAAASNHQVGFITIFRGVRTTGNPYDITPAGNGAAAATTFSIPGGTTTEADCLVCLVAAGNTDTAADQFGGWTNASLASLGEQEERWTTDGGGGGVALATGEKATAGAVSATTGTMASMTWSGIMFALVGEPAPAPYPFELLTPTPFTY